MPYSRLPASDQKALRASSALLYLLIIASGIFALVWTPRTIVGTLGTLTYVWGAGAIAAAAVALYSVIINRWRLEWVAVWFCASATSLYATTVTMILARGELTRAAQACITAALVVSLIRHGLLLGAHAKTVRTEHRSAAWSTSHR